MPAVAVAQTALALTAQQVFFAGKPVLFRTNSPKLAMYAREFFPESRDARSHSSPAHASITVNVREIEELCESVPFFRARGYFALVRFTPSDSFWFNLRTREVYGTCSPEVAADFRRWRAHIFPALLGILSATIDVVPVHAACLVHEGRGVLLAGYSGAGKSTLTIAMARRGYALLSDDWTYLAEPAGSVDCSGMQAWGLPVPVKLLPDANKFFPELLAYRADFSLNGEVAYEICPEECFEISRSLRCSVMTVVILERSSSPGYNIIPINQNEAIRHLQAEVEPLEGLLAGCYQRQLDLIQSVVESASCYRFSFNEHPYKVAEALDEALAMVS